MNKPYVSVMMITYNHENFIKEAIEGVLAQKTDFIVELVIGDDCSTDKTRQICSYYKGKYPDKIKLILNEKNLGVNLNFMNTFNACSGEYVAICEGDDYWTAPFKLQKQVDFLDTHPDFSMCFHRSQILSDDKAINGKINSKIDLDREIDGAFLYEKMPFQSASIVFRKRCLILPKSYFDYIFPDNAMTISLIDNGRIWGMSDIMSVYRKHSNGLSNPSWEKAISFIKMMDLIDRDYDNKYLKSTQVRRYNRFYYMATLYMKKKDGFYFFKSLRKCIIYNPYSLLKTEFWKLILDFGVIKFVK